MRCLLLFLLLAGLGAWAQNSSSSNSNSTPASQSNNTGQSSSSQTSSPQPRPNFTPPSSERVNADALPEGESSSKDDQIDLSPPAGDAAKHPNSSSLMTDGGVEEMRPWNPHKAAKDIEVGDFYFKRKNYRAAEDRYREALEYKGNDAVATYRLAVCLEKMDRPDDARQEYESYLRILPYGPDAEHAKKALDRLKTSATKESSTN